MDVLQDTFVKAFRSLTFRGESAYYTWLYRIAVNTAKNYIATRAKEAKGVSIDEDERAKYPPLQDIAAPEEEAGAEELQQNFLFYLQLPSTLKHALTLRELEGMSYDEIAVAMNCPIGTVRS